MKEAIETLSKLDRRLLGAGSESALKFIQHLIGLEILEFPTGTRAGTWTVPEEWIPKEAWVKFKGKKILDFKKNPLCLVDYSLPFKGKVSKEELAKHLHFSEDLPEATPYKFKFYDRDWGFCSPKTELKEGEYEVFIDTEFRTGKLQIGVHTIPGESEREILLFAHIDHPYQANDNISSVACLLDLATRIKSKHTIKLVFLPETIGSQIYIATQDLSKVEFVVALECVGTDGNILFQKSWDDQARINRVAHCALQMAGRPYRKGKFRTSIGSDESPFNDPGLGIQGVLLTRWPYKEYHTDRDTPEILDTERIKEVGDLVQKIIEIYEKDYIPQRNFRGLLMRSRYGIQSPVKVVNLNWDYFFYTMDGKKSLAELCAEYEMPFDDVYKNLEKIIDDGQISRLNIGERPLF